MRFDLLHPADQLVMIMDRIYNYGMTTTSGGNLSIRDQNGDVWITPSGVDKGSLTADDMILVRPDGDIIGRHKPSVELPFHLSIYRMRPDLGAILHAHPPTLVAFSLVRQLPDLRLLPDAPLILGELVMAKYAVPGSEELGKNIAECFEKGHNSVILENHGCVLGATDLFSAFMAFETLDYCARLEIDAKKLGQPRALSVSELEAFKAPRSPQLDAFIPRNASSAERAARKAMCRFILRSYKQRLFTSTQGTFSQRLPDGSFLITPYNKDRRYLEPEDLVLIKGGLAEAGKTPSRSVMLHEAIYRAHSKINSVIIAHPPSIMAFAVTDATFDSRIIPESYISLRNVKKLPYFSSKEDIPGTVQCLDRQTPVIIIENECVLVVGNTLLDAFDKLEVLEYSAKALIAATDIGEPVMISDKEIGDIETAFHMND